MPEAEGAKFSQIRSRCRRSHVFALYHLQIVGDDLVDIGRGGEIRHDPLSNQYIFVQKLARLFGKTPVVERVSVAT